MSYIKKIHDENHVALSSLCDGLELPRSTFYRNQVGDQLSDNAQLLGPKRSPHNALTIAQKQEILALLHCERFVDATPYEVYYTLLDEGQYIASVRTMYRILLENGESQDRRNQRNHRDAIKPELIATAPNQVWSWDITKLLSFNRFVYYHLYVIIDIFSRYVVGWIIADRECQQLAKQLIHKSTLKHGIPAGQLTLHSDNGPSMTSHTVSQLLERIGVLKTHNRPYTSNDNPFSESHFKTMKYCPQFPERFESLEGAERFCQSFFKWYNDKHYHSGILFLKPKSVHFKEAGNVLINRHQVLMDEYEKNPARFNHKKPVLRKLKPVYINPPKIQAGKNIDKTRLQASENVA